MITSQGKVFLKLSQAGQAGGTVRAISIGIGTSSPSINDTALDFEYARIPVDVVAYDFLNDKLIFKGTVPEGIVGKVYEVGIWTSEASNQLEDSRVLTSFDSQTETWTPGTYDTLTTRIGVDSLKHTPAANATSSSVLTDVLIDLSSYAGSDMLKFAFNVDNANVASIEFRFKTDSANYYKTTFTTPTAGYKIQSINKSAMVAVGSPSWGSIIELQVITNASAAGAASVEFDGIRIEDTDRTSDYGLVSRTVVSPFVMDGALPIDIEYPLSINIA